MEHRPVGPEGLVSWLVRNAGNLLHSKLAGWAVAVIGTAWFAWSKWLDALPSSIAGLVCLSAVAVLLAILFYLRRLWPRRRLSPIEEYNAGMAKKRIAERTLKQFAANFLGCANNANIRSEKVFLDMHNITVRFVGRALIRDELEEWISLLERVPGGGGTTKERLLESERWTSEIKDRLTRSRMRPEWDGR